MLLVLLSGSPATAWPREKLRILAWEGYADADTVLAFEKKYKADVDIIQINTDDELWERVNRNNAADYDVFAVNTAELQRYVNYGFSVPLNLANIPNRAHQLPRFRNLSSIPGVVRQNKVYAIPYTYSTMGLIYDQKKVREVPRSMSAMWDPAYRGKVLAYNGSSHNFSIAALVAGRHPFRLDQDGFSQAARKLIDLRRNVLTFYSSPQEAVKLFIDNDIVLVYGNYGTQQLKALRDAGADVGYIIPEEGAFAWLDCWTVTRGARNRQLAESWINFTLEKAVSERLTKRHGLANTLTYFADAREHDKIIWLEPVEDSVKRKQLWDRIMSGDSFVN